MCDSLAMLVHNIIYKHFFLSQQFIYIWIADFNNKTITPLLRTSVFEY